MTKEERKEYQRKYRKANIEKQKAYDKAYNAANSGKRAVQKKAWMNNKKDGFYSVYLLPKEKYVGQTNNFYRRLSEHKNRSDRDITDAKVLGKYATKKEALAVEASYHAKGYLGRNENLFE